MFFATSFDLATAMEFAAKSDQPPTRFEVNFQKPTWEGGLGCVHALYIEGITDVKTEREFLLSPYSAFKVLEEPDWNTNESNECSVIKIEAFYDNRKAPQDVPLAPWC